MKISNLYKLIKKTISSKKDVKNFILAYIVLRFETIRKIAIRYKCLKIKSSIELNKIFDNDPNMQKQEIELKSLGYTMLGKIMSDDDVRAMKSQLASLECYDYYQPSLGFFSPDSPPSNANIGGYSSSQLFSIKKVVEVANNSKILAVVQAYFGCKPTISTVAAWWSFPGAKKARTNQLFHRDFDDIKFLKLIIYLTDVDLNCGPHVYVTKTANMKALRRPTRCDDVSIGKLLPNNKRLSICGLAGQAFLADTFGWHKSELPTNGPRLVLQITYSINPIIDQLYNPCQYPGYEKFDSYINRLF